MASQLAPVVAERETFDLGAAEIDADPQLLHARDAAPVVDRRCQRRALFTRDQIARIADPSHQLPPFLYPGPRTGSPGRASVILPPEITALPLTNTCSTP